MVALAIHVLPLLRCQHLNAALIAGVPISPMDQRLDSPLLSSLLLCSILALQLLLSQQNIVVAADLDFSAGLESHTRELRKSKGEALTSTHGKPGSRPPSCQNECKNCHGECAASPVYLDRSRAHGHAVWTCICRL